jgi:cytochrome oxidase Cu insertion factor (SCO1/SenC/PrrC family)
MINIVSFITQCKSVCPELLDSSRMKQEIIDEVFHVIIGLKGKGKIVPLL